MRRVLDLDPLAGAPGTVAAVAALGDDALPAHHAGVPEHDRALDVLVEPDASGRVGGVPARHVGAPMARCAGRGSAQLVERRPYRLFVEAAAARLITSRVALMTRSG
jgi:hypothetical protein